MPLSEEEYKRKLAALRTKHGIVADKNQNAPNASVTNRFFEGLKHGASLGFAGKEPGKFTEDIAGNVGELGSFLIPATGALKIAKGVTSIPKLAAKLGTGKTADAAQGAIAGAELEAVRKLPEGQEENRLQNVALGGALGGVGTAALSGIPAISRFLRGTKPPAQTQEFVKPNPFVGSGDLPIVAESEALRTLKRLQADNGEFAKLATKNERGKPVFMSGVNIDKVVNSEARTFMAAADSAKVKPSQSIPEIYHQAQMRGFNAVDIQKEVGISLEEIPYWIAGQDALMVDLQTGLMAKQKAFMSNPALMNSKEAKKSLLLDIARTMAFTEKVSGTKGTIARAMTAMKRNKTGKDVYEHVLKQLSKNGSDDAIVETFLKIDPTNQLALTSFLKQIKPSTTREKIFEYWINSLLSGPTTQVVNTTGSGLNTLAKIIERGTSAGADVIRTSLTGAPRERFFGEMKSEVAGLWQGIPSAFKAMMDGWKTGLPKDFGSTLDSNFGKKAIKGAKGNIIRLPTRLLTGVDEFFKALNYSGSINTLAFREAKKLGLKGAEIPKKIAEIKKGVAEGKFEFSEIDMKATQEKLYRTFMSDDSMSTKLVQLRESMPGSEFILPFIRVPLNIVKQGLAHSPINVPRIYQKAMNGTLKGGDLSEEMSKVMIGTGMGMGVFSLAQDGIFTGQGPQNRGERSTWMQAGFKPYSFNMSALQRKFGGGDTAPKPGDNVVEYNRLDPLAITLGLAADSADIFGKDEEIDNAAAAKIVKSIANNVTSKTFMTGLSSFINAMTDPERYSESWMKTISGSFVPNILGQTTRAVDPTFRQAENIGDVVQSKLPFGGKEGSRGLAPKLDLFGREINRGGGFLERLASPVKTSVVKGKIDLELARLAGVKDVNGDPLFSKRVPNKRITVNKRKIDLSPQQHNEFIRLAGEPAFKLLERLMQGGRYQRMDDETKARIVNLILSRERKKARKLILRGL